MFVNERLPADKQIVYIPWDFHEAQKKYVCCVCVFMCLCVYVYAFTYSACSKNEDPVSPLVAIAETSLVKTGFFYSGVHGRHATTSEGFHMPSPTCEQNGIIRTNWYAAQPGDRSQHKDSHDVKC